MLTVSFYHLRPIEITMGELLATEQPNHYVEMFKLMRKTIQRPTHEELMIDADTKNRLTVNEATRVLNVAKIRTTGLQFSDMTFSHGEAMYMPALSLLATQRVSAGRVGLRFKADDAFKLRIQQKPKLLDVKVSAELLISGSSQTHNRRITGCLLIIDAQASDFGLTRPDVASHRRNSAQHNYSVAMAAA